VNVTDFVDELDARAREVRTTPAEVRLAGIRSRRRARRARAVAGIAAAGIAAGVLGAAVLPGAGRDRAVQPAWRVTFAPEFAAGDPLLASGHAKGRELVLRFTPRDRDTRLTLVGYCLATGPGRRAAVTINGKLFRRDSCTPDADPGRLTSNGSVAWSAAEPNVWITRYGVLPGRENVVRVVAIGAEVDELGVALYEFSGPRVTSDGVTLRRRIEFGGHVYRLAAHRTMPVTATARELALRATGQGAVLAGLLGTSTASTDVDVRVDGLPAVHGGNGFTLGPTVSRSQTTTVTVTGHVVGGALVVAYYLPE